jgi:two-component system, OmpR family, KDP operon response regulator KdpE
MVATKVLIIEDDPNIVDLIRSNLIVRGFDTVVSAGSKVIDLFDLERPDMVLLDLMLPGADGFELCRELRERSPVGIIVVSARGGEQDKVTALNMGADDYMTKPFGIEELLARIGATLRRTRPVAEAQAEPAPARIAIGGLSINLASKQVRLAGAEVRLTVPCAPTTAGLGPRVRGGDGIRPRVHQPAASQAGATWQSAADRHPAESGLSHSS